MSQSTSAVRFATAAGVPLVAAFDGGRLTSDGGLPWLAEAGTALGVGEGAAARLRGWGRGPVPPSPATPMRQRVFQIALGDGGPGDAVLLRAHPRWKLVCGRYPDSGEDLASQPTLSRLENAVERHTAERLAGVLVELYIRERGRHGPPTHLLLDVDGTDDPAHGRQEGVAYHGFYG